MNRFDGIKKVKVSLSRNTYGNRQRGKKERPPAAYSFARSNGERGERAAINLSAVIRVTLAAVMILSVMALIKVGIDVAELFRQDYIATYVD